MGAQALGRAEGPCWAAGRELGLIKSSQRKAK